MRNLLTFTIFFGAVCSWVLGNIETAVITTPITLSASPGSPATQEFEEDSVLMKITPKNSFLGKTFNQKSTTNLTLLDQVSFTVKGKLFNWVVVIDDTWVCAMTKSLELLVLRFTSDDWHTFMLIKTINLGQYVPDLKRAQMISFDMRYLPRFKKLLIAADHNFLLFDMANPDSPVFQKDAIVSMFRNTHFYELMDLEVEIEKEDRRVELASYILVATGSSGVDIYRINETSLMLDYQTTIETKEVMNKDAINIIQMIEDPVRNETNRLRIYALDELHGVFTFDLIFQTDGCVNSSGSSFLVQLPKPEYMQINFEDKTLYVTGFEKGAAMANTYVSEYYLQASDGSPTVSLNRMWKYFTPVNDMIIGKDFLYVFSENIFTTLRRKVPNQLVGDNDLLRTAKTSKDMMGVFIMPSNPDVGAVNDRMIIFNSNGASLNEVFKNNVAMVINYEAGNPGTTEEYTVESFAKSCPGSSSQSDDLYDGCIVKRLAKVQRDSYSSDGTILHTKNVFYTNTLFVGVIIGGAVLLIVITIIAMYRKFKTKSAMKHQQLMNMKSIGSDVAMNPKHMNTEAVKIMNGMDTHGDQPALVTLHHQKQSSEIPYLMKNYQGVQITSQETVMDEQGKNMKYKMHDSFDMEDTDK